MKKLFTICLLLATTFTVSAQQKPTKEETVAFMKRTLESAIGSRAPFIALKEVSFSENSYSTRIIFHDGRNGDMETSSIKWESLIPDQITIRKLRECTEVEVSFRYPAKVTKSIGGEKTSDESLSKISFYVPNDKAESFKKACLRLAEIAKEENKDPFQN